MRDSSRREMLLRLLAKWEASDIPLSEIYADAKHMGIKSPYQYRRDLEKKTYGAIIVSPQKGIVRFRDAMFKRYAGLRDSIYLGAKDSVDKYWAEHIDVPGEASE